MNMGYKGAMPEVAAEALLALAAKQPVFLVGGFGRCEGQLPRRLGWPIAEQDPRHMAGARNSSMAAFGRT